MRRFEPHSLWLGNAADLRSPGAFCEADIRAVVDLAANEPFPQLPRDLVYCRFPLIDGAGNDPQLLRLAIRTTADLLSGGIPNVVFCSNGLSRSPAIVAAALARHGAIPLDDALMRVALAGKHDVDPGFWHDVCAVS